MIDDPATRIDRLVREAQRTFEERFLALVAVLHRQLDLKVLEALLVSGQAEEAMRVIEAAAQRLGVTWTQSFTRAGETTADWLQRKLGRLEVHFGITNDRAVAAMRRNHLRLVREFTDQAREAARSAILGGVHAGANPIEVARRFRDSIGLTAQQERIVANYRATLEAGRAPTSYKLRDRRFDRSVKPGMPKAQIDKMVDDYRERFVAYRAKVIARTEAIRAAHEGSEEAYSQAIDDGILRADQLVRTWHPAGDRRVRDSHRSMEGQQQPFGQPFVSGHGARLRYPGDPTAPASDSIQCRCAMSTRITQDADLGSTGFAIVER